MIYFKKENLRTRKTIYWHTLHPYNIDFAEDTRSWLHESQWVSKLYFNLQLQQIRARNEQIVQICISPPFTSSSHCLTEAVASRKRRGLETHKLGNCFLRQRCWHATCPVCSTGRTLGRLHLAPSRLCPMHLLPCMLYPFAVVNHSHDPQLNPVESS